MDVTEAAFEAHRAITRAPPFVISTTYTANVGGAFALEPRGQTAADVEARFGAPQQKLEPRGGQKRQWPVIHRWVYPAFTVYFEKNRVIDVVLNQASADEIGPKPPIR